MTPDNAERIADILLKIEVVEKAMKEAEGDPLTVLRKAYNLLVELFMDYTRYFA